MWPELCKECSTKFSQKVTMNTKWVILAFNATTQATFSLGKFLTFLPLLWSPSISWGRLVPQLVCPAWKHRIVQWDREFYHGSPFLELHARTLHYFVILNILITMHLSPSNSRELFLITTTRLAFLRAFNVRVKIGHPDPSSHKLRELLLIQSTPFITDTVGTLSYSSYPHYSVTVGV